VERWTPCSMINSGDTETMLGLGDLGMFISIHTPAFNLGLSVFNHAHKRS